MGELDWIEEVSNNKVKVLELLKEIEGNMPKNFVNAFHKRRDLVNSYLVKAETLKTDIGRDTVTIERITIENLVSRLTHIHYDVTLHTHSYHKDRWVKEHMKNSLNNFKKMVKSSIEDIIKGDDCLWFVEANHYFGDDSWKTN